MKKCEERTIFHPEARLVGHRLRENPNYGVFLGAGVGLVGGVDFGDGEAAGGVVVVVPGPTGEGLELGLLLGSPQAPRAAAKATTKVKRINPLFIKTP